MSLAYVLIVFNYNKHPHTSFISNENLKNVFHPRFKGSCLFFFRRRKCRNDPPMVFFFRGASEIKFLNLFLLPVTRCDFGPCLVTQSFFLVFDLHAPIRHPHPFFICYSPYQLLFHIHAFDKNDRTRYVHLPCWCDVSPFAYFQTSFKLPRLI